MLSSIIIKEESGIDRVDEPVTLGLPFPRGLLVEPDRLTLIDPQNSSLPLQVDVRERWSDRSIKWGLLDFQATVAARQT